MKKTELTRVLKKEISLINQNNVLKYRASDFKHGTDESELIARKQLEMIKPNETFFKISND